ncbi:MAG: hypothetical protein PVI54_05775, partial [Desulfobacteraceae bacterium]
YDVIEEILRPILYLFIDPLSRFNRWRPSDIGPHQLVAKSKIRDRDRSPGTLRQQRRQAYIQKLSLQRAKAVKAYLVEKGIDKDVIF